MKTFSFFKPMPELVELYEKHPKRAWLIWLRCHLKALRNWQIWVAFVGVVFCAFLGSILGDIWGHYIAGAAAGGVVGVFAILEPIHNRMARRYICEYLDSHDEVSRA